MEKTKTVLKVIAAAFLLMLFVACSKDDCKDPDCDDDHAKLTNQQGYIA